MNIHRNAIDEIIPILPKRKTFTAENAPYTLILTIGFEKRTKAIANYIVNLAGARNMNVLLIEYPTNEEDNSANLPYFESLKPQVKDIKRLHYRRETFRSDIAETLKLLCPPGSSVLLDVSTISSYVFYPTMHILMEMDVELIIAYSEAEIYYPTLKEWEEIAKSARIEAEGNIFVKAFENAGFQSVGVDDVYAPCLFGEINAGNKPTILAAVPNFSPLRMNAIVTKDVETNKTDRHKIYWLIGVPPAEKNRWRMNAIMETNSLSATAQENIIEVCTLDYLEMLSQLEGLWLSSRYEYHMSIGALGSKMQHLGIYLFMYLHNDVGLWVSEPKSFKAKRFSEGIGNMWQIDFGKTRQLREMLGKYGQFQWTF